jgi:hypothetical protein
VSSPVSPESLALSLNLMKFGLAAILGLAYLTARSSLYLRWLLVLILCLTCSICSLILFCAAPDLLQGINLQTVDEDFEQAKEGAEEKAGGTFYFWKLAGWENSLIWFAVLALGVPEQATNALLALLVNYCSFHNLFSPGFCPVISANYKLFNIFHSGIFILPRLCFQALRLSTAVLAGAVVLSAVAIVTYFVIKIRKEALLLEDQGRLDGEEEAKGDVTRGGSADGKKKSDVNKKCGVETFSWGVWRLCGVQVSEYGTWSLLVWASSILLGSAAVVLILGSGRAAFYFSVPFILPAAVLSQALGARFDGYMFVHDESSSTSIMFWRNVFAVFVNGPVLGEHTKAILSNISKHEMTT